MKKFFYVAIVATALASCSSDQLVDLKEGDEIKITAVTDNGSRAADVYCQNNLPGDFLLYAKYTKDEGTAQNFIPGEKFTNNGNNVWVSEDGATRYWPEDGTLDFFAVKNAELGADYKTIAAFTPNATAKYQLDLLYAVATGKRKATSIADNQAVAMNFRHALSQIEFQAKNDNPRLYVEITGVKVGQAVKTATYTLPTTSTDGLLETHTNGVAGAVTRGEWSTWSEEKQDYEITFGAVELACATEAKSLSFETHDGSEGEVDNENSLLLLPQTTDEWEPAVGGTYNGSYLAVKCKIWNVSGESVNKTTDAVLHNEAYAVIPVAFNWEEGKKYVYTFNFTTAGNGGYEDAPANPQPVLFPITVSMTVDDFVNASEIDQDMETQP